MAHTTRRAWALYATQDSITGAGEASFVVAFSTGEGTIAALTRSGVVIPTCPTCTFWWILTTYITPRAVSWRIFTGCTLRFTLLAFLHSLDREHEFRACAGGVVNTVPATFGTDVGIIVTTRAIPNTGFAVIGCGNRLSESHLTRTCTGRARYTVAGQTLSLSDCTCLAY
jgi:hypothetical protein